MIKCIQRLALISSGLVLGSGLTIGYQRLLNRADVIKQEHTNRHSATLQVPLKLKGDPALGAENAPLTIVMFSDYECPYCKRFHDEVLPRLKEEYIKKGIVRLIHKDLPLPFHSTADPAARAARCSANNKEYWKVYSALFRDQGCLTCLGPSQIAQKVSTSNKSKLEDCMKSKRISLAIASNASEATLNNIKGTPTFIIGPSDKENASGEIVEGALPWPDFRVRIEKALIKTKRLKS